MDGLIIHTIFFFKLCGSKSFMDYHSEGCESTSFAFYILLMHVEHFA